MHRRALHHKLLQPGLYRGLAVVATAFALAAFTGCRKQAPPKALVRYETLPPKNVPAFMQGTIFEHTELQNTEFFPISGYGLVARLDHTGDSTAPTRVRDYMINLMVKHGINSKMMPGWEQITPERVLSDKRFAIVEVYGYLPPGLRKNQWFDLQVNALANNETTSLAHGILFRTDLRINGVNPVDPGGSVNIYARGQGQIFVNPAYSMSEDARRAAAARASLRGGIVLDGGISMTDRPLMLRLLQPKRAMARQIEWRIDQRFQTIADMPKPNGGRGLAVARDEGIVHLYVPPSFNGDWEHFANVATHLYFDNSAAYATRKAQELADAAQQPGAALMDISYCWEGLGPPALPFIRPLMESDRPDVAFAAARAAAFIGDVSAESALVNMASTRDHPFQLNAVQTLGGLPNSPAVNLMLRRLIDSDEAMVRIEAYRILARGRDSSVYSRVIKDKFVLDIVPSKGPPIIYATRTGLPRIAIIGDRASIAQPVMFTSMDSRFSISTADNNRGGVTLFYRGPELTRPIKVVSKPDVAEIVARLGGEGPVDEVNFNFGYGDIVSILQALGDSKRLSSVRSGEQIAASFVLQELTAAQDEIGRPPIIADDPNTGRPQGDTPPEIGGDHAIDEPREEPSGTMGSVDAGEARRQ